jgi:energy-coupling factor transporter transmembrane protein EcfT
VTVLAVLLSVPDLLIILLITTLVTLVVSKIPLRHLRFFIGFSAFIIIGTTASQAMFSGAALEPSARVIFWVIPQDFPFFGSITGGVPFTLEGAVYGFIQGFRIIAMLATSAMLVATTPFERLIAGLRELGLPATIMFMVTTAVRFAPTILEEFRMVVNALQTRGIAGNPIRMMEYAMAPLVLNSVRRCNQLALAADSRGFCCGRPRTSFTVEKMETTDYAALISISVFTGTLITLQACWGWFA